MDLTTCAVVIPSNRAVLAHRLTAIPDSVPVYIVEDGDVLAQCERPNTQTFSKDFQRRYMGSDYDLIPRGTAACRNFGFYYLWRETEYQRILSIDDDVSTRAGFLDAYTCLGEVRPVESVRSGDWINTIALFDEAPPCFARGFPFESRIPLAHSTTVTQARVVAHMGLWDGVLDTHAVDKQLFPEYQRTYFDLTVTRDAVDVTASGGRARYPLSSMNFGFVREALPAMYQAPMRSSFLDRYALWRYDDIWAGYLFQTLASIRGNACTVGAPIVRHEKAGNLQRELGGEHYGILLSPYFYGVVDHAARDLRPGAYVSMYAALMDRILTSQPEWAREHRVPRAYSTFIADLASTMLRWAELCARDRANSAA